MVIIIIGVSYSLRFVWSHMAYFFQSQHAPIYHTFRNLIGMVDFNENRLQDFEEALSLKDQSLLKEFSWIDVQNKDKTLERIQEAFRAIHEFLKTLYFHDKDRLKDLEVQKGVRAIMILCSEVVQNLDRYSDYLFKTHQSISQLKEYQELLEFYQKKLVKKLQKIKDQDEIWNIDWGDTSDNEYEEGIEDLNSVVCDTEYELFYLKKEDGSRFFSHNLLRHLKLIKDFYQVVLEVDQYDDFFKVFKIVRDKNCLELASLLKEEFSSKIHKFFKQRKHGKLEEFYSHLSNCLYAIYLASSAHNEKSKGSLKTCFDYYQDAWQFLQQAMQSPDYLQLLQGQGEDVKEKNPVIELAQELCLKMFLNVEKKDLIIGLISGLLKKNLSGKDEYLDINSKHLWNSLLERQHYLEERILKHPSSPIYNVIEDIYFYDGYKMFNPLLQKNYPSLLYRVHNEKMRSSLLRMPMPIHQEFIHEAEASPLFSGFIDGLKEKKQTYLLFNLQDKTSWKEFARSNLIESLPQQERYNGVLSVCTFPKSSDFYHQISEYEKLDQAKDFIKVFLDQISSEDQCGFHYSHLASKDKLASFAKQCIELIHEYFFGKKDILSQKNRKDFIEIFYQFFALKIIDEIKPTYFSFSCKDAIDIGPSVSAGFYGFIKLMGFDPAFGKEEEDFLSYLLFAPSLLIRERSINQKCAERGINALSIIDAELEIQRPKLIKAFEKLFGYSIFKNLCAEEIKN